MFIQYNNNESWVDFRLFVKKIARVKDERMYTVSRDAESDAEMPKKTLNIILPRRVLIVFTPVATVKISNFVGLFILYSEFQPSHIKLKQIIDKTFTRFDKYFFSKKFTHEQSIMAFESSNEFIFLKISDVFFIK